MTSARINMPAVALKDRIAALQQQKVSQSSSNDHHPISIVTGQPTGSLKDRIATFERKGAVPAPRGNYGLGAAPIDDSSYRRKGELYGNRVPGLSKPTVDSVLINPRKRTVSTPHMSQYMSSQPVSPTPPLPGLPTGPTREDGERPSTSMGLREDGPPGVLPLRLPSLFESSARRTVSDVLPHRHGSGDPEDEEPHSAVVPEEDEEELALEESGDVVSHEDKTELIVLEKEEKELTPKDENPPEQPIIVVSTQPSPVDSEESYSSPISPNDPYCAKVEESLASPDVLSFTSPDKETSSPGAQALNVENRNENPPTFSGFTQPSNNLDSSPADTTAVNPSFSPERVSWVIKGREINTPSEHEAPGFGDDTPSNSGATLAPIDGASTISPAALSGDTASLLDSIPSSNPNPDLPTPAVENSELAELTSKVPVVPALDAPATDDSRSLSTGSNLSVDNDLRNGSVLDASLAVVVTEPPQHISPTPTRVNSVPAPNCTSPALPPVSPVPPSSPWVSDLEELMSMPSSRQPLHTVVHPKVRENPTPTLAAPAETRETTKSDPSTHSPRRSRVTSTTRASIVVVEEPTDKQGLGDLAFLMQNAAKLEEQLSVNPPARASTNRKAKQSGIPPLADTPDACSTISSGRSEPTTPKQQERPLQLHPSPASYRSPSLLEEGEDQDTFNTFDSFNTSYASTTMSLFPAPVTSNLAYLNPSPPHSPSNRIVPPPGSLGGNSFASIRSRVLSNPSEDVPPTPPPKSPTSMRRSFTSFGAGKPRMPGSFPRESYSSEESFPSPPPPLYPPNGAAYDARSERSDTSSIRSSSTSMKSPKRSKSTISSFGRAGSVVERLWRGGKGKHDGDDAHLTAAAPPQRAPSPTHLSPYNLPTIPTLPRLPYEASTEQRRPSSWISVETTGSNGDVIDKDLFDSFPSVPENEPLPNSSYQYHTTPAHPSSNHYGHSSEMGYTRGARSTSRSKQRSAII